LEAGAFGWVISEPLLVELEETLLEPTVAARHGWSNTEIALYLQGVRARATVTPGTLEVDLPALAHRDPDDLAVLAAALEGGAELAVSQDHDLLDQHQFKTVRIVDPLEFLRLIRALEQPPP
jgi:predicted nucleic acid-binding protein